MQINMDKVAGLPAKETEQLSQLIRIYQYHEIANERKERYYEGAVTLGEVNIGIALPEGIGKLKIGCEWGAKAVDVLASRSMFDGFVSEYGEDIDALNEIMEKNNFISQYNRACRDELKLGCTFATLSADPQTGCKIRFHSEKTASAMWNGEKGRIECGMAIVDTMPDAVNENVWVASQINLYTDDAIWAVRYNGQSWFAQKYPHIMGRPLMVEMAWNGTSVKPFGRSRLKKPVRALIDGYIRTVANATIGLEFSTTPQKYLLGITDAQYDAVVSNKFKQYVGSLLAATQNLETGQNPQVGQFQQGTLQPHVDMMRILATQFSAATGLTVTDVGVVNDANPSSSDAILAQSQTLVLLAEQLNESNGDSLRLIAQMALAIAGKKKLEELEEDERSVIAHFKNPAMPSVAVTADAAIKIASAREGFASTDTFLEMIGFSQADVRRIKAQEQRHRGQKILTEEFERGDNGKTVGNVQREAKENQEEGLGADGGMDRGARNW